MIIEVSGFSAKPIACNLWRESLYEVSKSSVFLLDTFLFVKVTKSNTILICVEPFQSQEIIVTFSYSYSSQYHAYVEEGLTNCKGPDSKDFRICGPYGLCLSDSVLL